MSDVCPHCGDEYQRLAMHWNRSSCRYPSFDDRQMELLAGILMGDGDLHDRGDTNPHFRVRTTKEQFLEALDSRLGVLSKGVFPARTADEQARTARQNQENGVEGFETVNETGYSDLYGLRTCSHPELDRFRRWYDDGTKRFPEDIELTPTCAKAWFACDGWIAREESAGDRVMLKVTNEAHRSEFLVGLFADVGFEVGFSRHAVQIPHRESVRLLAWMGDPLPGFEHKWQLSGPGSTNA